MTAVPRTSAAPFCSAQARTAGEPLRGTAPVATGWLLVEQPGSWGRDALTESGLDGRIAEALARRSADLPVRVQVIRRPGHRRSVQRTVLLAHTGPERQWLRHLAVQDPRRLLDLDLELLLSPEEPTLGEPEDGPVLLVCTHAKRDQCCALRGRPVAAALDERHPGRVWESSHVGGHRFAGNLVVLPDGLVHGYVTPEDGERIVAAHARGEVDVETLRGRSGLPRAAQAAEVHVREHAGLRGRDDLRVREVADGPEGTTVTLEAGTRTFVATVAARPLGTAFLTGCDADVAKDPGAYELVDLHERDAG